MSVRLDCEAHCGLDGVTRCDGRAVCEAPETHQVDPCRRCVLVCQASTMLEAVATKGLA